MGNETELHRTVLGGLQQLIYMALRTAGSEQAMPTMLSADSSDEKIHSALKVAKRLRRLRNDFEEIATGAILNKSNPADTTDSSR